MNGTLLPQSDLTRVTLGVLVLALLVVGSLWILQPFLGALLWATMLVVATWPAMIRLQGRFGGRRWPAITILTGVMLLLLLVPIVFAVSTIVSHAEDVSGWLNEAANIVVPPPPKWVTDIPIIGAKLAHQWQQLAAVTHDELVSYVVPYARDAAEWVVGQIGGLGLLVLHFLMTVAIAAMLYATGEQAALGVRRFARRLAGDRGDQAVVLAGQAIRAVALGIVVTAIIQSVAAGIGLAICGVPYALVFTAFIFMLCMLQLGPLLVLVPAVGWLYWSGHPVSGTVMLVWTLIVGAIDNVLRPLLIRRGADLPLPLIFAGAIGGLVGFGIIGLFVGPVILAVTYRLLEWWIADIDHEPRSVSGSVSTNATIDTI